MTLKWFVTDSFSARVVGVALGWLAIEAAIIRLVGFRYGIEISIAVALWTFVTMLQLKSTKPPRTPE
jgi:hypothetical protein